MENPPTVRWSHQVGVIQLDQMAPESTLVVMPAGAHLVLLWTEAQARVAYERLRRLLDAERER